MTIEEMMRTYYSHSGRHSGHYLDKKVGGDHCNPVEDHVTHLPHSLRKDTDL